MSKAIRVGVRVAVRGALEVALLAGALTVGCRSAALTSAKVYMQQEEWAHAVEQLTPVLETDPQNSEAWQLLGVSQAWLGRYAEAGVAFDRAAATDTTRADEVGRWRRKFWVEPFNRGVNALHADDFETAAIAFEEAVALDAGGADAWRSLGYAYHQLERTDEALAAYGKAIEADPGHEETIVRLGYLHYNAGRYEDAVELLSGPAAGSDDSDLLGVLANAYLQLDRTHKAMAVLEAARVAAPGDADVLMELGGLHWNSKAFDHAAAAFGEATRLRPDDPDAHHNLAMALVELDRPSEALTALERVVELNDGSGDAWYWLGVLYARRSEVQRSETAFARAKALGVE